MLPQLRGLLKHCQVTRQQPGLTLFNALLNEEWFVAYPPRQLKAAIAGGAALHQAVAQRWEEVTGTRIVEGYGLTEASPVVTFNPLEGRRRIGSIGVPVPGSCCPTASNRPICPRRAIMATAPGNLPLATSRRSTSIRRCVRSGHRPTSAGWAWGKTGCAVMGAPVEGCFVHQ
jgi:acyl-CoA synthetase (AMP-forming)/AMP-acid ligase II